MPRHPDMETLLRTAPELDAPDRAAWNRRLDAALATTARQLEKLAKASGSDALQSDAARLKLRAEGR